MTVRFICQMTIFEFDKETEFFLVSFWSLVVVAGRCVSVLERCSWKRVPEIEVKHSPVFLAPCPLPLLFPLTFSISSQLLITFPPCTCLVLNTTCQFLQFQQKNQFTIGYDTGTRSAGKFTHRL